MSCDDCLKIAAAKKAARRDLLGRLQDAATAHGYDLWFRPGDASVDVLALPLGPSTGTPADLVATMQELKLPLSESPLRRAQRARQSRAGAPDRKSQPGREVWHIKGPPAVTLHFLT